MMHSRIFQISKEKIDKDEYISEGDYHESWFLGSVADYVQDSNRSDDIKWLKEVISTHFGDYAVFNNEDESFEFKDGFKTAYFKKSFESFKDMASRMDLETFSTSAFDTYAIRSLISDKFDFYFDGEMCGLSCMDDFIRGEAEFGVKYYIGGTVDFHV